jgi:hypothetical protein
MTNRMYSPLVASLSAVALMLAANETFARVGAGSRGGFASTHSHRSAAQSHRHHRGNNVGTFWPAVGGFYDGPSNVEPMVDATQPTPGDVQYTNTYGVPWDWAHRFPPLIAPSERPYVSSCTTETVTVAGHDGKEQTVNVTRCF